MARARRGDPFNACTNVWSTEYQVPDQTSMVTGDRTETSGASGWVSNFGTVEESVVVHQ